MKVYLAGGMKSGWQADAKKMLEGLVCLDPCDHGLVDPKEYTAKDLSMLDEADMVLAYFEHGNPSGFGMCAEIGYAKALGIPIVLVDEKRMESWDFIRAMCSVVTQDFASGIDSIKQIRKTTKPKGKRK
jgi:nucleoside 2-deoxyribosyltransferase